ncbi:MAG: Leu/Ile/Val/Thr-binding protein precursor [Firmicutes bacterium ADurb.Bin153]|nr:MAG: Leu/Ile/Val/Thr-binding protein precursor [Firmicutes bacterium ADurb.Bin153]
MKKVMILMLAAIMVMAAFSFAGAKGTIYFAWVGPLTGDAKQYGDTERAAIEIALQTIKDRGGVLGNDVVVDFFDDKNDATEAVTIANKIAGAKKYTAVIGHFSSTPAMAAAPIYEDAKIINYSPTASHANFSSLGEYIFRNTPTQAIETAAYADYVYNVLKIKTVAILNVNDDWGNNIARIFKENFQKLGGKVTITETFIPVQTKDFTPMITKIKQTNPDAFFPVAYYAESAQILIQCDSLNFKPKQMILSSSTLKQELIDLAGKLAEGCFLMNNFSPDIKGAEFEKVMSTYKAKTGKPGDAFVMNTYDTIMQLCEAIKLTGGYENIPAVRKTLAGMKDYQSLAGKYSMNELGDAVRPLQPIMVINGKFVNISNK